MRLLRKLVKKNPRPLVAFYSAGFNQNGQPVLKVECSCGWKHMTAYGHLFTAVDYLKNRFYTHYISDNHNNALLKRARLTNDKAW